MKTTVLGPIELEVEVRQISKTTRPGRARHAVLRELKRVASNTDERG